MPAPLGSMSLSIAICNIDVMIPLGVLQRLSFLPEITITYELCKFVTDLK
jgi:hypothetical protein